MRDGTARRRVGAAMVLASVGLFLGRTTVGACSDECPWDTSAFDHCEPEPDGQTCHYEDEHYYYESGGTCEP